MEQCVEAFAAADEHCNAARVALSTDPLFILRQSPALTNLSTTRDVISVLRNWLPAIIESNDTARSAVDSLIVSHERKREAFKWIVENVQSCAEPAKKRKRVKQHRDTAIEVSHVFHRIKLELVFHG